MERREIDNDIKTDDHGKKNNNKSQFIVAIMYV